MHVHANAAVSVDGKLATRRRRQIAISGPNDFERVERLRAEADAVMVGVGTVLADDPRLTVDAAHLGEDEDQPARVVLDSQGRTPADARVLSAAAETYLVTAEGADIDHLDGRARRLPVPTTDGRVDVDAALDRLAAAGHEHLLVEGGGEVLFSLFEAGAVDALTVFTSPAIIGGRDAPTLADGAGFTTRFPRLRLEAVDRLDDGVLCRYRVTGWGEEPSA